MEHNETHLFEYPGGVETRAFDPYCRACVAEVARATVLDEWGPGFRQVTVAPEPTLEELAAARDEALRDVWHAFGVSTYRGIPVFVSGYLVPQADLPPRGMPNSEARKRLEEGRPAPGEPVNTCGAAPVLTCLSCGRTAPDVQKTDLSAGPVCISDTEACTERRDQAKACLEPVPRSLGDVYRFRKRLRKASHALTQA